MQLTPVRGFQNQHSVTTIVPAGHTLCKMQEQWISHGRTRNPVPNLANRHCL
jgi:hypothetical protein